MESSEYFEVFLIELYPYQARIFVYTGKKDNPRENDFKVLISARDLFISRLRERFIELGIHKQKRYVFGALLRT